METAVTNLLSVAVGSVLGWLVRGWIGGPISDARDKRIRALKAAEQNAFVGYRASDARVAAAKAELNDAASALRSALRGHPWSVRLYCRLCRYDLEAAANWLITLHNMTGDIGHDEKRGEFIRDAVHVCLGAHRHLSRERVDEIRRYFEAVKRLEEASI